MMKKITLSFFLVLLLMASKISAQCTTGIKYPAGIHQATGAAGSDIINSDARTGEYADVHIEPSKYYTFTSSVATDYLTITNDTGTQIIASGVTPVSFVSAFNQTVRFYIHQNAQCQTTNQFVRTRKVTWVTAQPCLDPTPTGVTNISPISCTLNLTPPATAPNFGYDAYVSTSSATPGATVPTSDSTTSSIFVTNLNPDTTYYYWLRADCDYQKGAWIYGGTFTTISSLLCNSAYYGIYPSYTITPDCTGSDEYFATNVKNGSFSNIAVVPNTQYVFKTNYGTDFITITNALGTVVLASGITPVTWNSATTSGVVRFYSHDNAQCGYGITTGSPRNKYVNCITSSVTCMPPTTMTVANITSNSIRMSWTAPTNVPSNGYDIYIITTNTAPTGTSTATHTNTTLIKDINGLTAGVTYYYWIRSNCGTEKSSWASGGFFTTNQSFSCNGAIYGLYPDTTFTPTCTSSPEPIVSNAFAGQYSNVNIASNQQYVFSSSVGTDFISITNSAGTSILASGQTPLSWSSGANTGLVRYYLHANSNCGSQNTNRIKYMQCAATASCGVPTQLSVTNITSNSCRLNWTAPATAPTNYDIYIITTNTAPTNTTTATATSTTAGVGVLNGITAATTYYYWIRSNCNGTKSAWVSGGSFTTLAALTCNGATNGLYPEATFTPTCTGSPQQIVADAYAGEYANVNVVANTQYTFSTSLASDYITVTNTLGNTVLASGTTPLNWVSGTYSGVVRFHINTNANCGIQNTNRVRYIQCMGITTCGVPSNLAVSNITSNSCRLTWSPPATAPSGYDVYLATANTAPVSGTAATTTTTGTVIGSLNGLTASTTYYYWVRSNCNGTKSNWVSGGSFTTLTPLSCNGALYGLYPATTFTPSCTGSAE
ncbi:MAG: fibronectin type III domain-containing protein, partial [Flavobacteriaceae bacterium]|nr:fibronectin type III domain-containing protein [Flavobacteriaceae bacterium]